MTTTLKAYLVAIALAALFGAALGCTAMRELLKTGKAGAQETAAAAVETTEAILESGRETAKTAAETAETPWGMVGNWAAYIALTAAAAGCAWLKTKLTGSTAALAIVTQKIETDGNDSQATIDVKKNIRLAVKTKMDGEAGTTKAALCRALT
ncbi:hypothetical protein ES707_13389 [subsurface metagenome]